MTADPTEPIRRAMCAIDAGPEPKEQTWTTHQLLIDFKVLGFLAPFVIVRRRSDGVKGSLQFRSDPRVYFDFQED